MADGRAVCAVNGHHLREPAKAGQPGMVSGRAVSPGPRSSTADHRRTIRSWPLVVLATPGISPRFSFSFSWNPSKDLPRGPGGTGRSAATIRTGAAISFRTGEWNTEVISVK